MVKVEFKENKKTAKGDKVKDKEYNLLILTEVWSENQFFEDIFCP